MSSRGGEGEPPEELDGVARPSVDPAHIARVMAAELRGAPREPRASRLDELRRWRDRLDTVLQVVGDGVLVVDFAEQVVYANGPAARLLGRRSPPDVVGQRADAVLRGFDVFDERGERVANDRVTGLAALRGQPCPDVMLRLVRADTGEERWACARWAPIGDERSRAIAVVGVLRDCTREVRYETEQNRLLADAREAAQRKDEFLAMLAHELRNPLATVQYALELMRGHVRDPEYVEAKRSIAEREVKHLARLIDDLVDVSRVTRGVIELRREHVDLGALVARDARAHLPPAPGAGHRLSIEAPSVGPFVHADPLRITQVVGNLVRNAAKFTPSGGRIDVRVAVEGDAAVMRVRDDGAGIAPELLPHVFDAFVQGPQPLDRPSGGLGIGLAVVKRVAELHGGSAEVHSAGPGRGTEVVVRLPLATTIPELDASARPSAPAGADPDRAGAPQRILVVDDNVAGTRVLAMLLADWGCELCIANDGAEALALARELRPDVVLLDIGLPGMHGYEVARRLREECGLSGARIIAMSGYGDAAARRRSIEAGIDAHVVKPVDVADLRAIVFAPAPPSAAAVASGAPGDTEAHVARPRPAAE